MADYSTKQIIDYAMDDNGSEFRNALYASIHDKVTAHIEAKKQEVAENLLGLNGEQSEEQEEEYELEEDEELEEGLMNKVRAANYDRLSKRSEKQADKTKPGGVSVYDADKGAKADERADKAKKLREEEVEQIDELSKKTLGSYSRKSMDDLNLTSHLRSGLQQQKMYGTMHPDHEKGKTIDNLTRTNTKRQAGLNKAITRLSQEEVELEEGRMPSVITGTRTVKGGTFEHGAHKVEVRHNPEWQEYQVHHYKDGVHRGEGPVSYHGNDKEDAMNTAKWYHEKNQSGK